MKFYTQNEMEHGMLLMEAIVNYQRYAESSIFDDMSVEDIVELLAKCEHDWERSLEDNYFSEFVPKWVENYAQLDR